MRPFLFDFATPISTYALRYSKRAQYCCRYTVVGKTSLTLMLMNWGRLYHYQAHLCTAYLHTGSDLVLVFVNYLLLFFSSVIVAWELT